MRKTSMYLTDDEAEGLRRLATAAGKSQAELIREGVRRVIEEAEAKPRLFFSLGKGRGRGRPYSRWVADDLYRRTMGER